MSKWVRTKYDDAVSEVRGRIQSYWLNDAFLHGKQWYHWNTATNTVEAIPPPAHSDKYQATLNRMRANSRNIVARSTQRNLTFEVMPSRGDDSSLRAARLSERILRDLSFTHGWESIRERMVLTALKGGTAAIALDWDSDRQESRESVLSIAEFVVEPGSRDATKALWWIKAQALPPATVQEMFGLSKEPKPDARSAASIGYNSGIGRPFGGTPPALTTVLTYYERPSKSNKKGRWAAEVGGEIVAKGDWPFPWDDRLNLFVVHDTTSENFWYGSTILDDVRPLQVDLNLVWSSYIEHFQRAGSAKLLVPTSASSFMQNSTNTPGAMMQYPDGAAPPRYLEPPQIPSWLQNLSQELMSAIDDLMGVHDVSRGVAPPNVESGYGLSILAENDSTPVGRLVKETARAWSEVSTAVLEMYEAYATKKRVSTVDSGFGPEHIEWSGKDIDGQTKASVPLDAIIPRSRAAQAAIAEKLLEMGVIKSATEFIKFADMPGKDDLIQVLEPAVAKGRRMVHRLVAGDVNDPPIPDEFDDSGVIMKVLNEFRMTARYDELEGKRKENVDNFIQAHEVILAEKMARQQARAQASPALASQPTADNAPPFDPNQAPPAPQETAPAQEPPPEAIDPQALADAAMQAL